MHWNLSYPTIFNHIGSRFLVIAIQNWLLEQKLIKMLKIEFFHINYKSHFYNHTDWFVDGDSPSPVTENIQIPQAVGDYNSLPQSQESGHIPASPTGKSDRLWVKVRLWWVKLTSLLYALTVQGFRKPVEIKQERSQFLTLAGGEGKPTYWCGACTTDLVGGHRPTLYCVLFNAVYVHHIMLYMAYFDS